MAENAVLQLDNVSRYHGSRMVIDHCSCDLYPGEIVGLVGPNGSGKSTLIKLILGLFHLSEGSVRIQNKDISEIFRKPGNRVGAILEDPTHYEYMSGLDHLMMTARLYPDVSLERIREVTDMTGLKSCIRNKVSSYTTGQKHMLALAQALLPKPKLLILDEPTNGLDPVGIRELREILKKLAQEGVCIMVSSHILSEMDMLCSRIIIMKNGRFIADLSSHELLDPNRVRVRIRVGQPEQAVEILESLFDDISIRQENDELVITGENLQVPQMNRTLIFNEIDVYEIAINREPLEEYFLELMQEDKS